MMFRQLLKNVGYLLFMLVVSAVFLLGGCGDGSDGPELRSLEEPIVLEATETSAVMQSGTEKSYDDAQYLCEFYGLRLPSLWELNALADMYRDGGWLDRQLKHQDYWTDIALDDEEAMFARPATAVTGQSSREDRRGVLCMDGDEVPPPPANEGGFGEFVGKVAAFGTAVADLPGVKTLAPPVFSFALKQAGFDDYTERLKAIEAQLVEVKTQLDDMTVQIDRSTEDLNKAINRVEGKVEQEANLTRVSLLYPTDNILKIQGAAEKFSAGIDSEDGRMLAAAHDQVIYSDENMGFHLDKIHSVISSATAPIFNNLAHYLKYTSDPFVDKYQLLENLYLNLYQSQHLALSLFLEFSEATSAATISRAQKTATNLTTQVGTQSAGTNRTTFSHNVFQLLVNELRPYRTDGKFFPDRAGDVLKKAEFMRRGISGEPVNGLFGAFVTTADLYPGGFEILAYSSNDSDRRYPYRARVDAPVEMDGPTYDYRYADTPGDKALKLKAETAYQVYTFAFDNLLPGTYSVVVAAQGASYPVGQLLSDQWTARIGPDFDLIDQTAVVQPYNSQYQPSDTDVVGNYGYVLLGDRVRNRYTQDSTLTGLQEFKFKLVNRIGDVNDWPMGLYYRPETVVVGGAVISNDSSGEGKREIMAPFTYVKNDKLGNKRIHVDLKSSVTLKTGDGRTYSKGDGFVVDTKAIYVSGVYDKTAGKRVHGTEKNEILNHQVTDAYIFGKYQTRTRDYLIDRTFDFTPTPGHEYYVYMYVELLWAWHGAEARINDIENLSIRFGD